MSEPQPGILDDVPPAARYLTFALRDPTGAAAGLGAIAREVDGRETVVGLGEPLLRALGVHLRGLASFPARVGAGVAVPSTPTALWCWLRGEDRGALHHRGRALARALAPAFALEEAVDAFVYAGGRDLTGYEDGTENPTGGRAAEVAFAGPGSGTLEGSSFVAVQRWVHDLDRFDAMTWAEQDAAIGRRRADNEEMDDAPVSAHVKRTAQESFEPEAFVLRRSMPWTAGDEAGLMFVAFGRSLGAFEALLGRMTGAEDGVADALFAFTRPVTGAYFWCPPLRDGRLDLSALSG